MRLNTHPKDRHEMVDAISELMGTPSEYLRTPTYAYRIGDLIVDRDGGIVCDTPPDGLLGLLTDRGWLDTVTVQLPLTDWNDNRTENLRSLLFARQHLINRMLRIDTVHVDPQQDTMKGVSVSEGVFSMTLPFDADDPTRWQDCAALMGGMLRYAHDITRIRSAKTEPGSDKYHANAWLARLGFGGPEHKALRKRLMGHLDGYAAFRDEEHMKAHREKLTAKRRARRNENE